MTDQKGKISIGFIFLFLLIAYGAFAAVKYLGAGFTASQISNEIQEALYVRQGSDFSPEVGETAIRAILDKKKVFYEKDNEDAIVVKIDPNTFRISYYVEFDIDMDFIFFKKTKYVTIDKILSK